MKSTEIYFGYKNKYNNYIIFYKIGNFYNVMGEDTQIISALVGYKIKEENKVLKLGFPTISLEKVLKLVQSKKINYIVLEKVNLLLEITIRKKFNNNNYERALREYESYTKYNNRIDEIYNQLKANINKSDIEEKLTKIEALL